MIFTQSVCLLTVQIQTFPELNIDVPAAKNKAAFWFDTTADGKEDPRTFHGGAKVYDAEKVSEGCMYNSFIIT
jgi:hypothetical protein